MARSKALPVFLTWAGARLTVILRSHENSTAEFRSAALIRLSLSRTAESGRPTMKRPGNPGAESTSTRMI